MLLKKQVDRVYVEIFFIICISSVIKCSSVPCTFNTMCMCWIQDDEDFTKMDINCIGIPFARFPGRWTGTLIVKWIINKNFCNKSYIVQK